MRKLIHEFPDFEGIGSRVYFEPRVFDGMYFLDVTVVYRCSKKRFSALVSVGLLENTPSAVWECFGQAIAEVSHDTFVSMGIPDEPLIVSIFAEHVVSWEDVK